MLLGMPKDKSLLHVAPEPVDHSSRHFVVLPLEMRAQLIMRNAVFHGNAPTRSFGSTEMSLSNAWRRRRSENRLRSPRLIHPTQDTWRTTQHLPAAPDAESCSSPAP